ncbi:MAG TPA: C45 family autoproteolytic acyltransferase/hydrolase [Gemmatales bacterium]|nr:C45 family autoproteolytic acyltransferase/hydrolase [Gemmatales bacterium]
MRTALLAVLFFASPLFAAPPRAFTPDPASVQWCGPAYRYPQQGWIVVHIEGKPYERGYQYGTLLAKEIAGFAEGQGIYQSPKDASTGWRSLRTLTDALFLRRYDVELLEEMKGIADGAAAGGAKVFDRVVDLLDIVTVNSIVELGFLEAALGATPNGLEGKEFKEPPYARPKKVPMGHCSAFAATGPATKDGQLVIGHITMWNQYSSRWFNVWLDVQPEKGHRVMMQTNAGGIMSGTDYYQNDKGLILSETTIAQTPFNVNGWSLTARCRKAVQYATNIDECVEQLSGQNNGLYTNEWLIGDSKTNEIAMFEMGTNQKKLWRSSKNEWPGDTPGFYWGCNNTKDLQVRLDTQPCLNCRPFNTTFRPSERDKMWLKLYDDNKGKIDESFAFKAFTTAPLAAYPSLDVKFTTSALAKEFKSWGLFGPPLGKTWEPTDEEKKRYDFKVAPLVSNDWTMLSGDKPKAAATAGDVKSTSRTWVATTVDSSADGDADEYDDSVVTERNPAWNGTLLPKTDADVWLTTGFADYERIVSKMKQKKTEKDKDALGLALYAHAIKYRMATQRLGRETALSQLKLDPRENDGYDQATGRGVLVLHKLRETLGATTFDAALDQFGKTHAGKEIATADFRAHLEKVTGKSLEPFFSKYVNQAAPTDLSKPQWSIFGFDKNLEDTVIIYGTQAESAANKEAAERLQEVIARRYGNYRPVILKDSDVKTEAIKDKNLLLVGRPEANTVTAKMQNQFPLTIGPRSFKVGDATYAADQTGLIVSGAHPENGQRCTVAFMGLSAESTWKLVSQMGSSPCDALIVTSDAITPKVLKPIKLEE